MKQKQFKTLFVPAIIAVTVALTGCGSGDKGTDGTDTHSGGSTSTADSRPTGRFHFTEVLSSDAGCTAEFSAWVTAQLGSGAPTDWIASLEKTGTQSIEFTLEGGSGFSITLTPSSTDGVWEGLKTASGTISDCALSEAMGMLLKKDGDGVRVALADAWSNTNLGLACPFYSGSCTNTIVVRGTKI